MANSIEFKGKIHSIGDTLAYGSNGFTKREFVLLLTGDDENPAYPNHIALELTKERCALIDKCNIGDEINVHFNLSGRLWKPNDKPEKCFNSLQAWKIDSLATNSSPEPLTNSSNSSSTQNFSDFDFDDPPF